MVLETEAYYRVNKNMKTKLSVIIISLICVDNFFLSLHVREMHECIPITLRKATKFHYKYYSVDLLKAISSFGL